MLKPRGPAFAGLFFALVAISAASPKRLPASGQLYFRRFLERFTPLVVRYEQKDRRRNYRWDSSNRDCAGLARYVFHEALVELPASFYDHYPELHTILRPPAAGFSEVLRQWEHGNSTAPDLIRHARSLGRRFNDTEIQTGDLLYFESPRWHIRHVMMVIRAGKSVFIVYHTGDKRDELRIRTLSDLLALEESEWHPEPSNPVFRGVYRPEFLD